MHGFYSSCYTKITMKPDEQKQNYWQESVSESEQDAQSLADQSDVYVDVAGPTKNPVTWTAQEYVHLDKSPLWFVIFIFVVLGFIAVDILLLKSYTFSVLVVVMAIAVVIYTRRPPRTLTYALSAQQGLYVGERLYLFDEFKSFGLIRDNEHHSIMLIPRKRFSPGVSVYFPEASGEQIVDILGSRLPMEELKLDIIDIVVRKLRL